MSRRSAFSPIELLVVYDNEPYSFHGGGSNCLFVDGHVRFVRESIPLMTFAAMCTRDAGEIVNDDN